MREHVADARASAPHFSFLPFSLMTEQVVLGFDFGTRRIGVALGNSITRQARPLKVIASEAAARWEAINAVVHEWHPTQFVVGLPRHPDGAEHEMTRKSQRFGRQLAGRFGVPVAFVDERYSSAVLEGEHGSDADAAAIILQQWFDDVSASGEAK
jgi:putative holliday junction resolvase